MSVIVASLQGRFGNQCMQYLFCRALAERYGLDLRIQPWIGEKIFDLGCYARPDGSLNAVRVNEHKLLDLFHDDDLTRPTANYEFRGYAQMQKCMIYTKRQAQRWLTIRPEHLPALIRILLRYAPTCVVAHRRAGDYFGYGYPVVSIESYLDACKLYGLVPPTIISEEATSSHEGLPDDITFLADFYRMMMAPVLLRGNSSFSWLASLLGNGLTLSPVVDGLAGGREHLCLFVSGNHPRFANLDFVEDLYVNP